MTATIRVGVLSDTHDKVRPEAAATLRRSDLLLHAGDVCRPEVLDELSRIAPVYAVRGNNDRGSWARRLPRARTVDVGGYRIFLIHDLKELSFDPAERDLHAVVSGHSHQPRVERIGGVLFLNPGSAGPRRFKLPVAVARLQVGKTGLRAEIVELDTQK